MATVSLHPAESSFSALRGPQAAAGRSPAALPSTISIADIIARAQIGPDMEALEELLLARSHSRSGLISAAGAHTVRAGGKRLRAALAFLAARLGSAGTAGAIHAAAAAELIHAASLIHDDLVDQAARRRGHITVHARWDKDVALMVGDYFFALAAAEMALSPDPRIITIYAQAVQTIVEGELSPVTDVAPFDEALHQYLYKIGCKTAALLEAACKAGMIAGGGSESDIEAMGRYGYNLGMAFQIVDDVLDFTGSEAALGKPAGNDLRQGTLTLPLIYAVTRGDSSFLRNIARRGALTTADVMRAVAEVIAAGGAASAMADACHFAARAVAQLDQFGPSRTTEALVDLAAFVVERQA